MLLHDAARPLVGQRIIADCVAALGKANAVGVAVPTANTIVVVADGVMTRIRTGTACSGARLRRRSGGR